MYYFMPPAWPARARPRPFSIAIAMCICLYIIFMFIRFMFICLYVYVYAFLLGLLARGLGHFVMLYYFTILLLHIDILLHYLLCIIMPPARPARARPRPFSYS